MLHFELPNATLRRELIARWHEEVRGGIDIETAVTETEGFSFAEVEEVKNLLILHYIETKEWNWDWAMNQFGENRQELAMKERHVGFGALDPTANGHN